MNDYDFLLETVKTAKNLFDGMNILLDYCYHKYPNDIWNQLKNIPYEFDACLLKKWLEDVLLFEPPNENVKVFWFGLFNSMLDNRETTCLLYLAGSEDFDPDDKSGEWACNPTYFPEKRYFNSQVLHSIYRKISISDSAEVLSLGEYVLCMGYSCLVVKEICRSIKNDILLGVMQNRAIVVGFDDGDFILLGTIDRDGLIKFETQ